MRLTAAATATAALSGFAAGAAQAADLQVAVEIPRLTVAEYHRPYVSMWLERGDGSAVKTLAVWYDGKKAKEEGKTWLKDMRQWWRKAGRSETLANGVTGPTRAPGRQQISFKAGASPLGALQAGQYNLVVEAAREVGGREVVRVPFTWPAKGRQSASGKGSSELGAVSVTVTP
ncbi:DUF2271 domain-containing protein [Phenylobacterium deserti]|uniref:DUF2271 domain-containing protein n=1 Tax=Phenylobacterium deserti TaxID=1914756 RepID=A0A328ASW0_9CAUL|nr:DUF2271 domain-containing protein [Phenylobacterium deserti]RAK57351.1 DUF2271 domain-containing protein [Phenylobacterium deserti]